MRQHQHPADHPLTREVMPAVDHLAGLRVKAAPEAQRLSGAQRHPLGSTGYYRLSLQRDHRAHGPSSTMTLPRTADSTQSTVVPNATSTLRMPGP